MALIVSYFLVVVTTFPCPSSSEKIDVGIAIRKDEVDGKNTWSTET
jgi:hypothetical protein